jgi:hypothetical protein
LKIELNIDGENIPLNDFVESVLANIITGFISSLKLKKEKWNTLEIKLTEE